MFSESAIGVNKLHMRRPVRRLGRRGGAYRRAVGRRVAITRGGDNPAPPFLYCHDGNKNVSEIVSTDGVIDAHYEYSSFGKIVLVTSERGDGAVARLNPYRFSSEYHDDALRLVYYNYRHYNPGDGRWIGRDVLGEDVLPNLYCFCENRPFDVIDVLGLGEWNFTVDGFSAGNPDKFDGVNVSAEYIASPSEMKCCDAVIVKRYVRKFGIGPFSTGGILGPYVLDQELDESQIDIVHPNVGRAPADDPEGLGLGLGNSVFYRIAWSFDFLFEAICAKGHDAGKSLSTIQKTYVVEGHVPDEPYRGKFLPKYYPVNPNKILFPHILQ